MSTASIVLEARRQLLIEQAAVQRRTLAAQLLPWQLPLAIADRGVAAVRSIRRNPQWAIGALAIYVLLRPRGAGRWLRRGWSAWQLLRIWR